MDTIFKMDHSISSFAQVSLLAINGSMHSRQLSARETSIFKSEVVNRQRDSDVLDFLEASTSLKVESRLNTWSRKRITSMI